MDVIYFCYLLSIDVDWYEESMTFCIVHFRWFDRFIYDRLEWIYFCWGLRMAILGEVGGRYGGWRLGLGFDRDWGYWSCCLLYLLELGWGCWDFD
jgi:hypothetical protein